MLNKEQLETLLGEAMDSGADFAEIFEEDAVSESLSMLDGKVENGTGPCGQGPGSVCTRICRPPTVIPTARILTSCWRW